LLVPNVTVVGRVATADIDGITDRIDETTSASVPQLERRAKGLWSTVVSIGCDVVDVCDKRSTLTITTHRSSISRGGISVLEGETDEAVDTCWEWIWENREGAVGRSVDTVIPIAAAGPNSRVIGATVLKICTAVENVEGAAESNWITREDGGREIVSIVSRGIGEWGAISLTGHESVIVGEHSSVESDSSIAGEWIGGAVDGWEDGGHRESVSIHITVIRSTTAADLEIVTGRIHLKWGTTLTLGIEDVAENW
jgi:hypothetical protein